MHDARPSVTALTEGRVRCSLLRLRVGHPTNAILEHLVREWAMGVECIPRLHDFFELGIDGAGLWLGKQAERALCFESLLGLCEYHQLKARKVFRALPLPQRGNHITRLERGARRAHRIHWNDVVERYRRVRGVFVGWEQVYFAVARFGLIAYFAYLTIERCAHLATNGEKIKHQRGFEFAVAIVVLTKNMHGLKAIGRPVVEVEGAPRGGQCGDVVRHLC